MNRSANQGTGGGQESSSPSSKGITARTRSLRDRFRSKRSHTELAFKNLPPPAEPTQMPSQVGGFVGPPPSVSQDTESLQDDEALKASLIRSLVSGRAQVGGIFTESTASPKLSRGHLGGQLLNESGRQSSADAIRPTMGMIGGHGGPAGGDPYIQSSYNLVPEDAYCSALDINYQDGEPPRFPWQHDQAVQCDLIAIPLSRTSPGILTPEIPSRSPSKLDRLLGPGSWRSERTSPIPKLSTISQPDRLEPLSGSTYGSYSELGGKGVGGSFSASATLPTSPLILGAQSGHSESTSPIPPSLKSSATGLGSQLKDTIVGGMKYLKLSTGSGPPGMGGGGPSGSSIMSPTKGGTSMAKLLLSPSKKKVLQRAISFDSRGGGGGQGGYARLDNQSTCSVESPLASPSTRKKFLFDSVPPSSGEAGDQSLQDKTTKASRGEVAPMRPNSGESPLGTVFRRKYSKSLYVKDSVDFDGETQGFDNISMSPRKLSAERRKKYLMRRTPSSAPDSFDKPSPPQSPSQSQAQHTLMTTLDSDSYQSSGRRSRRGDEQEPSNQGLTFETMQRLKEFSYRETIKQDPSSCLQKPTMLLNIAAEAAGGSDHHGLLAPDRDGKGPGNYMNLPSPNMPPMTASQDPFSTSALVSATTASIISDEGQLSSSIETDRMTEREAFTGRTREDTTPTTALLHIRRRALVPPKLITDGYESSADDIETSPKDLKSGDGLDRLDVGSLGGKSRRRSSVVVIPPQMNICVGDLMVFSKAFDSNRPIPSGSTTNLNIPQADGDSSRKGKNTWSLLRLFDRSKGSKTDTISALEELLHSMKTSTWIDPQLSQYKGMSWCDFLSQFEDRRASSVISGQRLTHMSSESRRSSQQSTITATSQVSNAVNPKKPLLRTQTFDAPKIEEVLDESLLAATAHSTRSHSCVGPVPFVEQFRKLSAEPTERSIKEQPSIEESTDEAEGEGEGSFVGTTPQHQETGHQIPTPSFGGPVAPQVHLPPPTYPPPPLHVPPLNVSGGSSGISSETSPAAVSTALSPPGQAAGTEPRIGTEFYYTNPALVSSLAGISSTRSSFAVSRSEHKRREALWDLFQSECAFLYDHLMVLKNVFMEPLKKIQVEGYAMFAEPEVLFGNLDELCCVTYSFCKEFLRIIMEQINSESSEIQVSELIIKLFRCSKAAALRTAYHRYTLNYIQALNYLETLRRQVEFVEFEKWCSRDTRCKKLQLTDLLVSPVQHVMRIPLILKDIENRTEDLPERAVITDIIEKEEASLRELDDKMKWLKNFERLLEIQRNIVWPPVAELDPKIFIPDFLKTSLGRQPCERLIVSPRRQIILEGPLLNWDTGKPLDSYVILFDDLLLLTRRKKGLTKKQSSITEKWASSCGRSGSDKSSDGLFKYIVYKQPLSLDRFYIHDVSPTDAQLNNMKNGFVIVCLNRFQQIVTLHTFQAPNENSKMTWMTKLRDTADRWKRTLQNTVFRSQPRLSSASTNSYSSAHSHNQAAQPPVPGVSRGVQGFVPHRISMVPIQRSVSPMDNPHIILPGLFSSAGGRGGGGAPRPFLTPTHTSSGAHQPPHQIVSPVVSIPASTPVPPSRGFTPSPISPQRMTSPTS